MGYSTGLSGDQGQIRFSYSFIFIVFPLLVKTDKRMKSLSLRNLERSLFYITDGPKNLMVSPTTNELPSSAPNRDLYTLDMDSLFH